MTKKISLTIIPVLLMLLSNSAEAQKYTLQQCIDFAVNNSYAVRRVRADIKEADYQRQEARSGVLPQVRASGSMDDNVVLGKVVLPGEIIGQPGTSRPAKYGKPRFRTERPTGKRDNCFACGRNYRQRFF
jgi:outer membrane protein TolC